MSDSFTVPRCQFRTNQARQKLNDIGFSLDVTKTGNGEWGMGNGEWGMGNGKWGMGNGEWEIENGKWEIENGKLIFFTLTFYNVE